MLVEMAQHHLVPKLLLRRWAHPESGLIEVLDRSEWRLSRVDPARFAALPNFNTVLDGQGNPDDWIESTLLAGLDDAAARALHQIDALPRPRSIARQAESKGWHPTHLMSPRLTAGLAMWVAAQAVRSSTFRDAVSRSTTSDTQRQITRHYLEELANATDEDQQAHLRYMAGIRVLGTQFDQNTFPQLAAHLVVKLGEILYCEYCWAVQRMGRRSRHSCEHQRARSVRSLLARGHDRKARGFALGPAGRDCQASTRSNARQSSGCHAARSTAPADAFTYAPDETGTLRHAGHERPGV
jgi:hypothetical protein